MAQGDILRLRRFFERLVSSTNEEPGAATSNSFSFPDPPFTTPDPNSNSAVNVATAPATTAKPPPGVSPLSVSSTPVVNPNMAVKRVGVSSLFQDLIASPEDQAKAVSNSKLCGYFKDLIAIDQQDATVTTEVADTATQAVQYSVDREREAEEMSFHPRLSATMEKVGTVIAEPKVMADKGTQTQENPCFAVKEKFSVKRKREDKKKLLPKMPFSTATVSVADDTKEKKKKKSRNRKFYRVSSAAVAVEAAKENKKKKSRNRKFYRVSFAAAAVEAAKENKKKKSRNRKFYRVSSAAVAVEAAKEKKKFYRKGISEAARKVSTEMGTVRRVKSQNQQTVSCHSANVSAAVTRAQERREDASISSNKIYAAVDVQQQANTAGSHRSKDPLKLYRSWLENKQEKHQKRNSKVQRQKEVLHPRSPDCQGLIRKAESKMVQHTAVEPYQTEPIRRVVEEEVKRRNKLRHLPINGKCYVSFYRNYLSKPQWEGPFKVVKRVTDNSYLVHGNGYDRLFNINRLKNCFKTPHAFVPQVSVSKELVNNLKKSNVKHLHSKFLPSANKPVISHCTNPSQLQGSRRNKHLNRHLFDAGFSRFSLDGESWRENEMVKRNLLKLVSLSRPGSGAASSCLDRTPAGIDGRTGNTCSASTKEHHPTEPYLRLTSPGKVTTKPDQKVRIAGLPTV